jgi:hypothetical protein
MFDSGARKLLGRKHTTLIEEARAALRREQHEALAAIRAQPVTRLERLTPVDYLVGAPAWRNDGSVTFAAWGPHGRARLHTLSPDGDLSSSGDEARAIANLRSPGEDILVYHEFNWRVISRIHARDHTLGWRVLQPDLQRVDGDEAVELAGIRLPGGGTQELFVQRLRLPRPRLLGGGVDVEEPVVIPTQDRPWSPTFRPGRAADQRQLCWVETDRHGSRLLLAPLRNPAERRELLAVRGRILHPVWSADGRSLYYCSDHSGVANAYCLRLGDTDGVVELLPVTNTIGGVIACVPSPDGKQLALVEHDRHGRYLAKLANDPAVWAKELVVIENPWPAPLRQSSDAVGEQDPQRPTRGFAGTLPPPRPILDLGDDYRPRAYNGFAEFRPLFWTPTLLPVPEGGIGIAGLGADPLFTHVVAAGVGAGLDQGTPVGFLGHAYSGWPVEFSLAGWQSERTYQDLAIDVNNNRFDVTERVRTAEFSVGRGLAGLERRFRLFGTVGIADHKELLDSKIRFGNRVRSTIQPLATFEGQEQYVEVTLGYDDATFFPTSYAPEDGLIAVAEYRHSGFGGDLTRNVAFANASYVWSVIPSLNHQLVVGGQAGWSDGDRTLQGNFAIGGFTGRGLPRGYIDTEVTGRHLAAGSIAYRLPVFTKFQGISTTPLRHRQLVLEVFFDAAKISTDHWLGNGGWFRTVGAILNTSWEFDGALIQPGLGVGYELDKGFDGSRDVSLLVSLGFRL